MAKQGTIKVKSGDGYATINRADYDPKQHQPYDDEAREAVKADGDTNDRLAEMAAERQANAQYGQTGGGATAETATRNPSGTYAEPTPSDIRYPNQDDTEFENNHGAFVGKSAAQMRETRGLPDKPGGLNPAKKEAEDAKAAAARAETRQARQGETAPNEAQSGGNLDEMTVAELRDYAEQRNIDLGDASKKDDIRAAIDKSEQR